MAIKVNEAAVNHAKKLINEGKVVIEGHWNQAQPKAEEENKFVEQHDWKEYGKWYLGLNTDKPDNEKQHYEFPYGDFKKVHREGLLAAKRRAGQYKHPELEKAADELLRLIEKKEGIKTK